jgi:hypothetical protein
MLLRFEGQIGNVYSGTACRAHMPKREWVLARPSRPALSLALALLTGGGCDGTPTSPSRPTPRVVIDSPTGGTVGVMVTFRWHLDNAESGETYRYELRLDKGMNACDNAIEQSLQADTRTCLAVELPAPIYDGQRVEFGVRATDSTGQAFCTMGNAISVNASTPALAPCPP